MARRSVKIGSATILLAVLCVFNACTEDTPRPKPPQIDATKFEPVYRAAKGIQGALTVGVNYAKFGELLQAFATEVSSAADKANRPEEQKVLGAYKEILSIYKDSFVIWQRDINEHNNPKGLAGLPVGEVDVRNEIVPIVEKYKLPTKARTQEYSGYKYKTISSESKQFLWQLADEKIRAVVALTSGQPVQEDIFRK